MTLQAADCRSLDIGRHPLASTPWPLRVVEAPPNVYVLAWGWGDIFMWQEMPYPVWNPRGAFNLP